MYDHVVKCQRAGLCLSEHFLISCCVSVSVRLWVISVNVLNWCCIWLTIAYFLLRELHFGFDITLTGHWATSEYYYFSWNFYHLLLTAKGTFLGVRPSKSLTSFFDATLTLVTNRMHVPGVIKDIHKVMLNSCIHKNVLNNQLYVDGKGIAKVHFGTGAAQASAKFELLKVWEVSSEVIGMSFDTTASNTGSTNGACTLLEHKLQWNLLHFASRHHVYELIIGGVFTALFGPSRSPDIALWTISAFLAKHIPAWLQAAWWSAPGSAWFPTPSKLLRHEVLHSGDKPYACPRCDKRYS